MDAWTSEAPVSRTRTAEFMAGVYRWMAFGLALTGIVAWAVTSSPSLLQAFYRFLARGQMKVSDLVTHRFEPRQAAEAYRLLTTRRDEAMGVVFDFSKVT